MLGEFDIRPYVGAFAMDVITSSAFGVNADSINNPEHPIVANVKNILGFNANISIFLSVVMPKLAKLLGMEPFDVKAINYFSALTQQIVAERKKLQKNDKKGENEVIVI